MAGAGIKFTNANVKRLIVEARAIGGRTEYRDALTPGLMLRIGRDAVWSLRVRIGGEERRIDLGDATTVSVDEARAKAATARSEARSGGDPRLEVTGKQGVLLEKLIDDYLAYVQKTLRQKTYDDYRKVLKNNTKLKEYATSPVNAIKSEHINSITDDYLARDQFPSALAFVNRVSRLWAWALSTEKYHIQDLRIRRPSREREQKPEKVLAEFHRVNERVPKLEDLRKVEEKAKALSYVNFAAAMTVLYTAQRINTVVQMHSVLVRILDDGWGVWFVPHPHRKSASTRNNADAPHYVPLHPRLVGILRPLIDAQKNDKGFVFPITRPRFKDQAPKYPHLNSNTITHNYHEIKAGFSPHKVRHGFSTYMQKVFKHRPDTPKIILDHLEGNQGDITIEHYIVDEREQEKRDLLSQWIGYISAKPDDKMDTKTMQGLYKRVLADHIASQSKT